MNDVYLLEKFCESIPYGNEQVSTLEGLSVRAMKSLLRKATLCVEYNLEKASLARMILEHFDQSWKNNKPETTRLCDNATLVVYKGFGGYRIEDFSSLELTHNPEGKIYGKTIVMHRDMGFYSNVADGYRFAGQIVRSQPLTGILKRLITEINAVSRSYISGNNVFNSILVNYYANGDDYIGAHSDNELFLAGDCVVALSLGSSRKFIIKRKDKNSSKDELDVTRLNTSKDKLDVTRLNVRVDDGDLLFMSGSMFQKCYTHEVPKEKNITSPRLSLTFRYHLPNLPQSVINERLSL